MLLEDNKMCYCQHWNLVLVLVDFQDKCKLLVYILSILPRVVI